MKIIIRKAKASDAKKIAEIKKGSWKYTLRNTYSKERIRKKLEEAEKPEKLFNKWSRNSEIFVAIAKKDIIGYIVYRKKPGRIFIVSFHVDRKHRKKGIGTKMLRFVENRTKAKTCTLTALSLPATLSFYHKFNYKKLRTVRKKSGDIDIVMIKRIRK